MPSIIFADSYYPQVLASLPKTGCYWDREQQLNRLHFGTSYYYSKSFFQMGWEIKDIVVNDPEGPTLEDWVKWHNPDIIYFQDLNCISTSTMLQWKSEGIKLVAQHSCPWAGDDRIKLFDIVFTSFPHYIKRIQDLGVKSDFLPIAFGHWVLDYVEPTTRDIDISFVGGVGGGNMGSGHWDRGTQLLERIASVFGPSTFKWFGYGRNNLLPNSNLSNCFQGPAWGIEQYKIYARSKIVVNRHGEVAQGYSNNMRMFEATGMGACLFTEDSENIQLYFNPNECVRYNSIEDCIAKIQDRLSDNPLNLGWEQIAQAGQARTLKDHTYEKRLKEIEPILRDLIK